MPLPPGLILNPQTGEIAGVPTVIGTFDFRLRVRDALGTQRVLDEDIEIKPYTPMTYTSGYAPMMRTRAYSSAPVINGGLAPILFSQIGGVLPAGLSLNPANGVISGTPSAVQSFGFTVRGTDALNQTKDLTTNGLVAENLTLSAAFSPRGTTTIAFGTPAPVRAGGTAPYTYSIAAGTLPPGLALNASTGIVSGTPTAAGTYAGIVLRVTDTYGFTGDSAAQTITIALYPTLSGTLGHGTVGTAWAGGSFALTGGHAPIVWAATGLPAGLSINTSTGVITGTPSVSGTFNVTVTATDNVGTVATRSQQIEVANTVTLTGTAPPATKAFAYNFQPVAAGGWPPYTWSQVSGSWPAGISFNAANGLVSGIPTTQQTTSATIRVTDADGNFANLVVGITVAGDLSLTGSTPPLVTNTVSYSGSTYAASGGQLPYSWSIVNGALPNGMTINSATGALGGTPNATPGVYNCAIRVTDANGSQVESNLSFTVANFPALTGALTDATNGVAYDQGLSASGGHLPLVWSISAGALPTGLTLNTSTGRITGTPTVNGTYNFTVRIADQAGNAATAARAIGVFATVALTGGYQAEVEGSFSDGSWGSAYSWAMGTTGGKAPISWSIVGTLPPGLTLNNSTGLISGTVGFVAESGFRDYAFTVTVTDALGRTASSNQNIRAYSRVRPADTLIGGTQGVGYSRQLTSTAGKAPYTYSAFSLPAGLSGNSAGLVTGTPSGSGSANFSYTITDALGVTYGQSGAIWLNAAVNVAGDAGDGSVGIGYGYTYSVSGGNGVYSWAVVSGALPPGLSLNGSGQIVGTPTVAGSYNWWVRATSAGSIKDLSDGMVVYSLPTASPAIPGSWESGIGTAGWVNGSGGKAPLTYAVVAGSLPPGVGLDGSNGWVGGTPTAAGTWGAHFRVTDALGRIYDTPAIYFTVAAHVYNAGGWAGSGKVGQGYDSTPGLSGGWGGYSWAIVGGGIPAGLNFDAGSGRIYGTPSTPGTYNFTIRVTDALGAISDAGGSITIAAASAALSVSASPNPAYGKATTSSANVAVTVGATASASGGTGSYSYNWVFLSANNYYGSAVMATINGPSGPTIARRGTGKIDWFGEEFWRCDVSDGVSTASVNVLLQLEIDNVNQSPG